MANTLGLIALMRTAVFAMAVCVLAGAPAAAWAARHALVIGNNAYPGNELRSAVNDARDIAAALKQAGFDVMLRENTGRDTMFQAIQEFGTRLRDGDVALFYFAGHAIQVRDRNYLIPVDAKVKQEDDVTFYSLDVSEVLQRMDRARTRANILVLDACRDNPFASTVRFTATGLAQMSAPPGTLIAYATAPGQVAREGTGRNGVFTKHLLRNMTAANQPIELTLKRVREGVLADTKGQQVPWDSSSLRGDFAFTGEGGSAVTVAPVSAPSVDVRMNIERTFWESIKDSRDPREFDAYINQFPDGVFAILAKSRLQQMSNNDAGSRRSSGTQASAAAAGPATAASAPVTSAPAPAPVAFAPAPTATAPPSSAPAPVVASSLPAPAPAPSPAARPAPTVLAQAETGLARSVAPSVQAPAAAPQQLALLTQPQAAAPGPKVLADGSTLYGELRDGKAHGKGRLVSKTGGDYNGDFVNGIREGQGEQRWLNGDHYIGAFKADRPSGQGVMVFATGDRYEGGFEAGTFMGEGKLAVKTGFQYEGSFVAGRRQGKGKARFPEGNRYSGDFANDLPAGNGVMEFADGARYEGDFTDGRPAGKGTYRFPDGSRYEGAFLAGLMSGLGVYHFKNGDRIEGQFENGAAAGTAIHFFAAGGRFEGVFTDQGRNATGVTIDAEGKRRPGKLESGQFKAIEG